MFDTCSPSEDDASAPSSNARGRGFRGGGGRGFRRGGGRGRGGRGGGAFGAMDPSMRPPPRKRRIITTGARQRRCACELFYPPASIVYIVAPKNSSFSCIVFFRAILCEGPPRWRSWKYSSYVQSCHPVRAVRGGRSGRGRRLRRNCATDRSMRPPPRKRRIITAGARQRRCSWEFSFFALLSSAFCPHLSSSEPSPNWVDLGWDDPYPNVLAKSAQKSSCLHPSREALVEVRKQGKNQAGTLLFTLLHEVSRSCALSDRAIL